MIIKSNKANSYQESYNIQYNGNYLVYGQYAVDYQVQSSEYCLDNYDNGQYDLNLQCIGCTSWYPGSNLEIRGLYGNIVYKGYLHGTSWEAIRIQIMYFVKRNDYWMYHIGDAPSNWYDNTAPMQDWQYTNVGTPIPCGTGTQYFRKQLWGLATSAIEFRLTYQYGVVIYLNGVEIARDHMPEGPITPTTPATGSYPSSGEHGFIRNAYDWGTVSNPAFCVEIHAPQDVVMNTIDFDAWVAPLGQTVSSTQCHALSTVPTITATSGTNVQAVYDYDDNTYFSADSNQNVTLTFSYSNLFAQVNGLEIYSGSYYTSSPTSFSLSGVRDEVSTTILERSGVQFNSYGTYVTTAPFTLNHYNKFTFTMTASDATTYTLPEFRLMVCNLASPTSMSYTPDSFVVFAQFEGINPTLNNYGFSDCSVSPPLPSGIELDPSTCAISGTPQVPIPETEFTITSTIGPGYTATIKITSIVCEQNMIQLKRTYKSSATREMYSITNEQNEVIFNVDANSGQKASTTEYKYLCIPDGRYKVTLDVNSVVYWVSGSFLEIFLVIQYEEYEQILRVRYDNNIHLPTTYYFDAHFLVSGLDQWYYKMGEVPSNWYGSEVEGWEQASRGTFPSSTNSIQLYKKKFTVGSLANASAFALSIRYQFGCVVYVNNREVFRNRVTGDLSTSSVASDSYSSVRYRTVTLPITTYVIDDSPAIQYLISGENTIAIALVADSTQEKTSDFDCIVYLLDQMTYSRIFDYSASCTGMTGTCTNLWNDYYSSTVYSTSTSCKDNSMIITFNNDRREWIGSYSLTMTYNKMDDLVTAFSLYARNGEDDWVELDEQSGWVYWGEGQEKKMFLKNNLPYNQYKFVNFRNEGSSCAWKLSRAALFTERTDLEVPELTYSDISVYKDIEMAEEYPSSDLYYNFRVNPSFPDGLKLDPSTGVILGTPTTISETRTYTITANKYNGPEVSTELSLGVNRCYNQRSLITVKIRTDTKPKEMGYKIFEGRGIEGNVFRERTELPASSTLFYVDNCMPHGIYTLQTIDTASSGWATPAGYMLSVDVGELVFDLNQMPEDTAPVTQTTVFSSFLPFQLEFDAWQVWNLMGSVPSNWNDVAFEPSSSWKTCLSSEISESDGMTFYVRRTFEIPVLDEVSVMNIRVRYSGGLVGYFNGRKVVRFNMPDIYDSETEALTTRDSEAFSKFHVLLNTVGATHDTNVMAFEIHRAPGASISDPVSFGATAVLGAEECSPVINTFTYYNVTSLTSGNIDALFDMDITTSLQFRNVKSFTLQWQFENQEPVRFNAYAFQPGISFSSFGWSLYSRELDEDDWNLAHKATSESFTRRERKVLQSVGSLLGYRNYQYIIEDTASSTPTIYEMIFLYCEATGTYCAGEGDYPPVEEGGISPSTCPDGFLGYTYRECTDGKLGPVKTDTCRYKVPTDLYYPSSTYIFVMDTHVTTGRPSWKNIIQVFFMDDHVYLPLGLELDPVTGEISGVPIEVSEMTSFTIYGRNERATTMFVLNIQVREGICHATGFFETTKVGHVATYSCSQQGSFVGTQKCACLLGEEDGEWQEITGICFSISMIVLLVVLAVIVIAAVLFFVVRTSKRVKAVGGVRNKPQGGKKNGSLGKRKVMKV